MTVNEMKRAIGWTVMVRFETVRVACKIMDVKQSYGIPRLLITPVSGSDSQWIQMERVITVLESADTNRAEFIRSLAN